jgi:formate hydrogenlyase subunit 3/multisubunit Na+/H+ antiporter MnhD subunit
MVEAFSQPLYIFILGLGGGFLIPLLHRVGTPLPPLGFFLSLFGMTIISAACFGSLLKGAPPFEILTSGSLPPLSINLRLGWWEGLFALSVNVVAVLGAWHLWDRLRESYVAMLLYLVLTMGISGMVMTRDLFNLFVFLEIVSVATYGLLGLGRTSAAITASFNYILATVIASTFFLLGTALLYYVTGVLNIDDLVQNRMSMTGPIAGTALLLVLCCLLVELKPFPANGWGIDVYETAPSGVAALVSVGVSAGIFFALFKLLPLFEDQLGLIAVAGGLTFLFSNLIGLRQPRVQRLLGYSSIAQMGLLTLSLALLTELRADAAMPLVIGGLFVNHLFAKAGLFWLAGAMKQPEVKAWAGLVRMPFTLVVFALLLIAIAGLPPFPGFWAKWELVMRLAAAEKLGWIALVLVGSLLEAAYMFRWFGVALGEPRSGELPKLPWASLAPVVACAGLLLVAGYVTAGAAGAASLWLFAPICAGAALYLLDWLPGRVKNILMLFTVFAVGTWLIGPVTGINRLFAVLLFVGSIVVVSASLYRTDSRPGFHPLMAMMLISVPALLRATTSLEFFYCWEIITLTSYLLIAQGRNSGPHIQSFLLFSLGSAFLLLAGFALAAAANGSIELAAFRTAGPEATGAVLFLGLGFLVKAGAVGVHVWLPGAYAEADDDMSAVLSSVISKLAIFGLLVGTYMVIRSGIGLDVTRVMGWIGLLTTLAGALMALHQTDLKRMLAYSSMSQLGYIITAIALMSHLGWVTALYLVANHLMVKGMLFLAAAGIVLRCGTRSLGDLGGLARNMPLSFFTVVFALVAMSGLPPLMGFGGKWLLLSAMTDKGLYGQLVIGLLVTFIGFLYMTRLAWKLFLGPRKTELAGTTEAPVLLLVPQLVLAAGILLLSFYPKLLMDPVAAAIDPYFASTLVWEGMALETIYGYWNPVPVMMASTMVALILFLATWFVYRRQRAHEVGMAGQTPDNRGAILAAWNRTSVYDFYQPALATILTPVAIRFWGGLWAIVNGTGERLRKIYTGNGQTYALCILYYFIALHVLDRLGIGGLQ